MKTARFSQVVARSGAPKVHDQWLPQAKDATLKKAVRELRVMTVHTQTIGGRKDHGEVGLADVPQRVLLIFPRTLRPFEGRRIVGIDYSLLNRGPQSDLKKRSANGLTQTKKSSVRHKGGDQPGGLRARQEFQPETEVPAMAKRKVLSQKTTKAERAVDVVRKTERQLRAGIRQAMDELQAGKTVQAYQTLENALA